MTIEDLIRLFRQYQNSHYYNSTTEFASFIAYLENLHWGKP